MFLKLLFIRKCNQIVYDILLLHQIGELLKKRVKFNY